MSITMNSDALLSRLKDGDAALVFAEVMAAIDADWVFSPVAFRNGSVDNKAGENSGSCKVFAFAALHDLDEAQTLRLFGEHYQAVLDDPDGDAHANIRAFMAHGWAGISMPEAALKPRQPH